MSRARIVKQKRLVQDPQLVTMFNDMLNSENGDTSVILEKNVSIRSNLSIIAKVLEDFSSGPFRKLGGEYEIWCEEFLKFASQIREILTLTEYREIKDNNITKHVILVCRELVAYANQLQPQTLSDRWILSHPGLQFEPFAFTKMDIKHVWNDERVSETAKKYCLRVFSILFQKCHEIYKTVTSPDIDVNKFSQIIIESIERVKDVPELNRCRDAFDKIKESVSLLENNFSDYYKDMVQSENPSTLIENFIIDVSQGQNMNIGLMRQFRIIINFYQKQSKGKIKDPKIQALFNNLNSKMDMLEKNTPNVKVDSDSSDTDEEDKTNNG